jgi:sugar lactone lactonase YvrE
VAWADRVFHWVDIVGRSVFCYDPVTGETTTIASGEMVTALSETSAGGLLFVTPKALLAWSDGNLTRLAPLSLSERVRTNDGKCDPAGRLWFGTMDHETREPIAELFVYDGDRIHPVQDGIILSNGLGWSPDREIMYHVDSIRRHVYAYRYDQETGAVVDRRVLADMGDLEGVPDGLAVDVDGNLWVAIYDGWCVRVVDPHGDVEHEESLEVQKPTSVAFGGPGLSDLCPGPQPGRIGRSTDLGSSTPPRSRDLRSGARSIRSLDVEQAMTDLSAETVVVGHVEDDRLALGIDPEPGGRGKYRDVVEMPVSDLLTVRGHGHAPRGQVDFDSNG